MRQLLNQFQPANTRSSGMHFAPQEGSRKALNQ